MAASSIACPTEPCPLLVQTLRMAIDFLCFKSHSRGLCCGCTVIGNSILPSSMHTRTKNARQKRSLHHLNHLSIQRESTSVSCKLFVDCGSNMLVHTKHLSKAKFCLKKVYAFLSLPLLVLPNSFLTKRYGLVNTTIHFARSNFAQSC